MNERRIAGIVLLVLGVAGFIYGFNYMKGIGWQTGQSLGLSDSTGWVFIGAGLALALLGLYLTSQNSTATPAKQASGQCRCPKCKTPVEPDAKKCPGCGGLFKAGVEAGLTEGLTKKCPDCAEEVKEDARKCRFCGHVFSTDKVVE